MERLFGAQYRDEAGLLPAPYFSLGDSRPPFGVERRTLELLRVVIRHSTDEKATGQALLLLGTTAFFREDNETAAEHLSNFVRCQPDRPLAPAALRCALAAQVRLVFGRRSGPAQWSEMGRLLALAQNYPELTAKKAGPQGRFDLLAPLLEQFEHQTGYRELFLIEGDAPQSLDPSQKPAGDPWP